LTGGVELRVDLGYAADRVFVNNTSFGTYAAVVDDPAYRDAKARTILQKLPRLLTGEAALALRMTAGGRRVTGLKAVLVGNNSYGRAIDAARPGRRERLDAAAPPKPHAWRAGRAPAASSGSAPARSPSRPTPPRRRSVSTVNTSFCPVLWCAAARPEPYGSACHATALLSRSPAGQRPTGLA
ncbi:hypothetical protein ACFWEZ_38235, partial [Streptomyces sp. NPDC060131]